MVDWAMAKRWKLLLLGALVAGLSAQTGSKVTSVAVDVIPGTNPWTDKGPCGGLGAELWSDGKG